MLTIAEVSGLIAAAVMIVQYTLPAALVVILVKYTNTVNSAVTWSVLNRTISTTVWPLLFRADAVRFRHVPLSTRIITEAALVCAVILVAASVLTPLGLYEEIVPGQSKLVEFEYAKDLGPWGRVTMPRPNLKFNRHCESGRHINCPGQFQGVIFNETSPGTLKSVELYEGATINLTIPENYTAMFTSATSDKGNTVSGLFDIQYRRWRLDRWGVLDKGEPYVRGESRYIESLITQDDILLREGLIIDMRENPGIGFRNHTIPVGLKHGGSWSEDITWIEVVTHCADTNLTIERRDENSVEDIINNRSMFIVDRGAFIGLNYTALESPPWNDNQTLDLFGRAYKAARMHNVLVASSLNISLPLNPQTRTLPKISVPSPDPRINSQNQEQILRGNLGMIGSKSPTVPGYSNLSNFVPYYPDHIKKLLALNYSAITEICRGFYGLDSTNLDRRANNISYPAVQCGSLLGAPLQSPSSNLSMLSYSGIDTYRRNLYVCASGLRASIKTIDFQYNGTGGLLANLRVLRIRDKAYPNERSKPLWAVETSEPLRMWFDPLWGIVSDLYEKMDGFYTQRSEGLWLPTSPFLILNFGEREGYDALAAASGFIKRLSNAYSSGLAILTDRDYSGEKEYTLFERYQRLSQNATGASQIPSLILTDGLAAGLVGTKTSISNKYVEWPATLAVDDRVRGFPQAQVTVNRRVIRYKISYAIPGFLVLAVLLVALVATIWIIASSAGLILTTMQRMYNQTSAGRLATNLLLDRSDPRQRTSEWMNGDGAVQLSFGHISAPEQDHFVSVLESSSGNNSKIAESEGAPAGRSTPEAAKAKGVPLVTESERNDGRTY
jgi:hypothetical protein